MGLETYSLKKTQQYKGHQPNNRKCDSFCDRERKKTIRKERIEREEERRRTAQEVYRIILTSEYNDVSLQKIKDFIDDVTPRNPYGRRLSERLPQRVERALYERERSCAIDALFSRASESAVPANERSGASGKRAVEAKKRELIERWAKATGNWHTDLNEFTDNTEAVSEDTTDSDVYRIRTKNRKTMALTMEEKLAMLMQAEANVSAAEKESEETQESGEEPKESEEQ